MKPLRRWMKRTRTSQSALARALDVSQPTVWAWLNGTKCPTVENLERIADVTGLTVDQLLGRELVLQVVRKAG